MDLPTCPIKSIGNQLKPAFNLLAWLSVKYKKRCKLNCNLLKKISIYVGESGLGKSTLVNTLFNTQLYPPKEIAELSSQVTQTVEIKSTTADIEENGVKLKLTVVDTPGFGDFVNNEERYVVVTRE